MRLRHHRLFFGLWEEDLVELELGLGVGSRVGDWGVEFLVVDLAGYWALVVEFEHMLRLEDFVMVGWEDLKEGIDLVVDLVVVD